MKTFKSKKLNNKGFTLIELLAVIVILAIVMAMTMATVLPLAAKMRKDAFATEVNSIISAAGDEMTMIAIDTHRDGTGMLVDDGTHKDYRKITSGDTTKYCFTMKKLVELGHLEKSQKALASDYQGYVVVSTKSGQNFYTYTTKVHNTQYSIDTTSDEVTGDEVKDYSPTGNDTEAAAYNCSSVS